MELGNLNVLVSSSCFLFNDYIIRKFIRTLDLFFMTSHDLRHDELLSNRSLVAG